MSESVQIRGSEAVKAALVDAACDLLAEVGPRALSIRNVAERAGVNHGQIHHYFGGKRGLLRAAMAALAAEHWQNSLDLAGGAPVPPILSLSEDERYWQATCRTVMEGDLDLARVELDEGLSVPRRAYEAMCQTHGIDENDLDAKAYFSVMVACQLGWVAFEEYTMTLADVPQEERDAFRLRVKALLERHAASVLKARPRV